MAKIIVVDGKRYSFPDEATEADISSALQKTFAPPPPRAPFDGLSKPAAPPPQMLDRNPAGEGAAPRVPNPGVPKPEDSLMGFGHTLSDTLAPYGVAAGVGALAGSPAGGIGAIPGAGIGVGTLVLGDTGANLWNVGANAFGGPRMTPPSETIRQGLRATGLSNAPETPAQRTLASGVDAMAQGFSLGHGAQVAADFLPAGVNTMRGIARSLSAAPGVSAAANFSAGAAPQALAEAGVTDPLILAGVSMGAGMGTGIAANRVANPVVRAPNTTIETLNNTAQAAYKDAADKGVTFRNPRSGIVHPMDSRMDPTTKTFEKLGVPALERQVAFWDDALDEAATAVDTAHASGDAMAIRRADVTLKKTSASRDAAAKQWEAKHPDISDENRLVVAAKAKWDTAIKAEEDAYDAVQKAERAFGRTSKTDADGNVIDFGKADDAKQKLTAAETARAQAVLDRSTAGTAYDSQLLDFQQVREAFTPTASKPTMADNAVTPKDAPQFFGGMRKELADAAESMGYLPNTHPTIRAILDDTLRTTKTQLTWANLRNMVRTIKEQVGRSGDGDERRIGRELTDIMDDWMSRDTTTVNGKGAEALAAHNRASELTRRAKGAEDLSTIIEEARADVSGPTGSGNLAGTLQRRFRALTRSRNRMRFFTREEQDAIRAAARGGSAMERVTGAVGSLGPSGSPLGILRGSAGGVLAFLGGGGAVGAVAYPAVTLGARAAANHMTSGRANELVNLMTNGAPAVNPGAARPPVGPSIAPAVLNQMARER